MSDAAETPRSCRAWVRLENRHGLHARPAHLLVQTANAYANSQRIDSYKILEAADIDIDHDGPYRLGDLQVEVFDPVADYVKLMESLFDFDRIRALLDSGLFQPALRCR